MVEVLIVLAGDMVMDTIASSSKVFKMVLGFLNSARYGTHFHVLTEKGVKEMWNPQQGEDNTGQSQEEFGASEYMYQSFNSRAILGLFGLT